MSRFRHSFFDFCFSFHLIPSFSVFQGCIYAFSRDGSLLALFILEIRPCAEGLSHKEIFCFLGFYEGVLSGVTGEVEGAAASRYGFC